MTDEYIYEEFDTEFLEKTVDLCRERGFDEQTIVVIGFCLGSEQAYDKYKGENEAPWRIFYNRMIEADISDQDVALDLALSVAGIEI